MEFIDIYVLLSMYFLSVHNSYISFLKLPQFRIKDPTDPFVVAKILNFLPENILDNGFWWQCGGIGVCSEGCGTPTISTG